MKNFFKFIIHHFKTLSFIGGFALDIILLPKTTSPHYMWIGPIDITVILLLIVIRQSIKRSLNRRGKRIKKDLKNAKEQEDKEKISTKTGWHKFLEKSNSWATYGVSFFLGTLLSHTLVYYFRSSDMLQMWPIFLIVLLAILANEFLYGTIPDILLFYIALTFFFIFNVPIALNRVNTYTFFVSILVSVIVTSILSVIIQRIYLSSKEFIMLIIFSIIFPFLVLQLYYMNYIPAVPLALGESGFYSKVEKISNQNKYYYDLEEKCITEKKSLFIIKDTFCDIDQLASNEFYFFSSIISPADVSANISHVWEIYDPEKDTWVKKSEIEYPISGGREDGYRGYSEVSNISKGKWRVKVLADGRLVGLKKILIK